MKRRIFNSQCSKNPMYVICTIFVHVTFDDIDILTYGHVI